MAQDCDNCPNCGLSNLTHADVEKLTAEVERLNTELNAHYTTYMRSSNEKLTRQVLKMKEHHFSYVQNVGDLKFEMMRENAAKFIRRKELQVSHDTLQRKNTYLHQEIQKQRDMQYWAELTHREIKMRLVLHTRYKELHRLNKDLSKGRSKLMKDLREKNEECNDLKKCQARLQRMVKRKQANFDEIEDKLFSQEIKTNSVFTSSKEKLSQKDEELHQSRMELKLAEEQVESSRVVVASWKEKYQKAEQKCSKMQKRALDSRSEVLNLYEERRQIKVDYEALKMENRKHRAEEKTLKQQLSEVLSEAAKVKKCGNEGKNLAPALQKKIKDLTSDLVRGTDEMEEQMARCHHLQISKDDLQDRYQTENAILRHRLQETLQLTNIEKDYAQPIWQATWNQYRSTPDSKSEKEASPLNVVRHQTVDLSVKNQRIVELNEALKKRISDLMSELMLARSKANSTLRISKARLGVLKKWLFLQMKALEVKLKESIEQITTLQKIITKEQGETEIMRLKIEGKRHKPVRPRPRPVESPEESGKVIPSSSWSTIVNSKGTPRPHVPSMYPQGKALAKVSKSGKLPSCNFKQSPSKNTSKEVTPPSDVLEFVKKMKPPGYYARDKKNKIATFLPPGSKKK